MRYTVKLAHPIRFLLNYVGTDFEDVQYEQGDAPDYSWEDWLKVKHTLGLDFPNLPYFIDGDIKITQSNAILRHIGRKHNLLGESEAEKVLVDIMENECMDFRMGLIQLCYGPDFDTNKKTYLESVHASLALFEKYLGDHPWFVGGKITVVDFPMYESLNDHRIFDESLLTKYPKLTDFLKRFEELPKIKDYMSSPTFMKRPLYGKAAHFR